MVENLSKNLSFNCLQSKCYRPGNLVQFRAVVVDQRLKPSVVGSIDVSAKDGNGNLIKRWDRVFTTKGSYSYMTFWCRLIQNIFKLVIIYQHNDFICLTFI